MSQAIILLTEIQRQNSSIVLLKRGGAIDQIKECFVSTSNENEKQELFNAWIQELVKRLESKMENVEVFRVILNLVEDVLYYNQTIDRKPSIEFCKQHATKFAKEVQHSLENPVWQMF